MGKKLKLSILALVGVLGVAAFAPAAKADEGRFDEGRYGFYGERFDHGDRYRNDWRRERFEHERWERHHGWRPWNRWYR
jgi:hypothetical protein